MDFRPFFRYFALMPAWEVKQIQTQECIPLRSKVLRPHHPLEDCHYPQDPSAVHFGCFVEGELLSIVTALYNFMHGQGLERDVREWFPIQVPKTLIPAKLVAGAL